MAGNRDWGRCSIPHSEATVTGWDIRLARECEYPRIREGLFPPAGESLDFTESPRLARLHTALSRSLPTRSVVGAGHGVIAPLGAAYGLRRGLRGGRWRGRSSP